MHLRIANDIGLNMILVGINLVPRASLLTQSNCLSSQISRGKKALGTRLSGHASLLSFEIQQEQSVFIQ